MRFLFCLVFAAFAAVQLVRQQPTIVMSAWYNGPGTVPPAALRGKVPSETLRSDLEAIRRAGFNGIVTWISWADGEPSRGALDLVQLDRLVALAMEAKLHVAIEVYTDDQPAWKKDGTNALAGTFYERVRDRYAAWRPAVTVRFAVSHTTGVPFSFQVGDGVAPSVRDIRLNVWDDFSNGRRGWSFRSDSGPLTPTMRAVGELAALLTSNQALFAPVVARTSNNVVTVEPAGGIDVRILESADAIVIVGLNPTDRTQRVKLTFPPDIPEAIWQNMEAGNAVHFVMGPNGPFYEHTFAPRDALVLAIRKKLR